MDKILELAEINGCDSNTFISLLHQTLLLFVFEEVCHKLKNEPITKERIRSDFRKTNNHSSVCKKLIREVCGTKLTESDADLISTWIESFFRKSDLRNPVSYLEKQRLLALQGNKCACCNQPLKIEDSHYDHIIPWDYVGDVLPNNYQMLCSYCNEHKSNNVHYLLKRQLVKKNT